MKSIFNQALIDKTSKKCISLFSIPTVSLRKQAKFGEFSFLGKSIQVENKSFTKCKQLPIIIAQRSFKKINMGQKWQNLIPIRVNKCQNGRYLNHNHFNQGEFWRTIFGSCWVSKVFLQNSVIREILLKSISWKERMKYDLRWC